jgi:hypothetical protein
MQELSKGDHLRVSLRVVILDLKFLLIELHIGISGCYFSHDSQGIEEFGPSLTVIIQNDSPSVWQRMFQVSDALQFSKD